MRILKEYSSSDCIPIGARNIFARRRIPVSDKISAMRLFMAATAVFGVLLSMARTSDARALELSGDVFHDFVKKSGKNVFVKFLAPW